MTTRFVFIAKILLLINSFFYFCISVFFFQLLSAQAAIAVIETRMIVLMDLTWITAFLIMITSITGCCIFACKENKRFILSYANLVLFCLTFEITIISVTMILLDAVPEDAIKNKITKYNTLSLDVQSAIQTAQQNLKCCGFDSWRDYDLKMYQMPNSCCGKFKKNNPSYQNGKCQLNEIIEKGCKDQFIEIGQSLKPFKLGTTYFGSFIFFVIQLGALALSFGMVYSMKRDEKAKLQQTEMRQV